MFELQLLAHMRLPDLIDSHYSNLTDQVETDSTDVDSTDVVQLMCPHSSHNEAVTTSLRIDVRTSL